MAYYSCPDCDQLFHEPQPAAFVWCSCGAPLSAADMVEGPKPDPSDPVSDPPASEEPEAGAAAPEGLDQFDRRAMVGAIYSPCFLRAIVKQRLGDIDDENTVFAVAVSDGSQVGTIAVQITTAAADGEVELLEVVEHAVEQAAAAFPRETRLADLLERSPLRVASPTPSRPPGVTAPQP
jgi:hypothetical protein